MNQLLFNILFWGVFVGGGSIFAIFAFVMAVKQYKQDKAKQKELKESENIRPNEPEYTTVTIKATVVDQVCFVKTVGIKTPKTVKEFVIVFKTENGDILKLNVPEEMYDGFVNGQTGILSIIDGELYGFELEENSDEIF